MLREYLPVLFQIVAAAGFAGAMLGLSVLLGRRGRREGVKNEPYECGMLPVGEGTPRFSVKFYLVAMLSVIFAIEVVFMYPWAVQFAALMASSHMALLSMAGFAGILGVAYFYVLKKGALNWNA